MPRKVVEEREGYECVICLDLHDSPEAAEACARIDVEDFSSRFGAWRRRQLNEEKKRRVSGEERR